MENLGNKYALHAIRERRAELAGELKALESKLRHLRDSLVHVDATLRLFDPDADPSSIPAKRPYKRVKLFGAGKLNRMILGALREAAKPVSTQEVLDAIVAELGFGPEAAKGLKNRVRANLVYLTRVRGLVVKDGEREGASWHVKTGADETKLWPSPESMRELYPSNRQIEDRNGSKTRLRHRRPQKLAHTSK